MEKELTHAEISQKAILSWAFSSKDESAMKQLLSVIPKKYFGEYENIVSYIRENGTEYTEEFAHFLVENESVSRYVEIVSDSIICLNPYEEAKNLCRIGLGDMRVIRKSEYLVDILKEYSELVEEIDGMKSETRLRSSKGDEVFFSLMADMAERQNSTEPLLGLSTGFPCIDHITDGLRKGTVTRLNAYPNTGKSKFSYHLTNNLVKQGYKGLYISMEVGQNEVALNLSANWYGIDYYTLAKGQEIPDFSEYPIDLIYIVDNIRKMDDIEAMVHSIKPDFLVMDYVQKIRVDGSTIYEKMSEVANRIQDLAVAEKVAVFDLSQVSRGNKDFSNGDEIPSKGAGELVEAADIALVMTRKPNESFVEIHVAKNKFGRNNASFYFQPDFLKSTFHERGEVGCKDF